MRDSVQRAGLADGTEKSLGLGGLAEFLLRVWTDRTTRTARKKRMQLLETLPLGGKRQMMLVRCDGEEFLVGGGFETIETIVKIGRSSEAGGACE